VTKEDSVPDPDDETWRSNPSFLRATAWVPDDDPHRPWAEAAELAADWIWERANIEQSTPLLVTNVVGSSELPDVLKDIAQRGGRTSPQAKSRHDRGPVLAYVPHEAALQLAVDLARGYSLAVVETLRFPLTGWAAGVGAIDLLKGTRTMELTEAVRKQLDSTVFFGGNNGWSGSHEKEDARRHLIPLVHSGDLTIEDAVSYVMSQGVSDRGAKRLRTLLERN
jgi:hypothetical protein